MRKKDEMPSEKLMFKVILLCKECVHLLHLLDLHGLEDLLEDVLLGSEVRLEEVPLLLAVLVHQVRPLFRLVLDGLEDVGVGGAVTAPE